MVAGLARLAGDCWAEDVALDRLERRPAPNLWGIGRVVVYNGRVPWTVPLSLAPPAWPASELGRLQPLFAQWCKGIPRPRFGDWRLALGANMMETSTMLSETLREWDARLVDKGRQQGFRAGRREASQKRLKEREPDYAVRRSDVSALPPAKAWPASLPC